MREFRKKTNTFTDRTNDSVGMYLREISHMDRLSPDEEAELASLVRRGGKDADEARERLIKANLRFVVTVAKQYKSDLLELSDLISEGNMGLIKAVNLYDETKGFKFISYAVWWIRQTILTAIDKSSTMIRLPQNQQKILRQYHQMQEDMLQKEQRQITVDEFCEVSGYGIDTVACILGSAAKPVKMDQKVNEDGDSTFGDLMASDAVSDSKLDKESLHKDLEDAIGKLLTSREAFVIKHLYGLDGEPWTLDEVAEEVGLSRERVRQISLCSLQKLRRSSYASRLCIHLAA